MDNSTANLLSLQNPVLRAFVFWAGFLILKIGLMSFLGSGQAFFTRRFQKPRAGEKIEDLVEENVARARRAHRNDLENVIPLILVMGLYVLSNPDYQVAVNLFRVLVAFRIWHTLVYGVYEIRQPARGIGFLVPWVIMIYMSIMVMIGFSGSA